MSFTLTVAYDPAAYSLGQGWDPIKANPVGPIALVDPVTSRHNVDANALQQTKLISNSEDYQSLMDVAVNGSFSGWGASVSASASVLEQEQVSIKSEIFGASAAYRQADEIINTETAKLNPTAKAILIEDPDKFLRTYGPAFIAGQALGGFFTGYYAYTMENTEHKQEINAKLSAQYAGLWSGSASAQTKINNIASSYNLKQSSFVQARGAQSLDGATTMPDLVKNFNSFVHQMSMGGPKASPLGMVCKSWDQLNDVAATLNAHGKSFSNYPPKVSQASFQRMGSLYGKFSYFMNSIETTGAKGIYNKGRLEKISRAVKNGYDAFDKITLDNIEHPPSSFRSATTLPAGLEQDLTEILQGKYGLSWSYALDSTYTDVNSAFPVAPAVAQLPGGTTVLLTAKKGDDKQVKIEAEWNNGTYRVHGEWPNGTDNGDYADPNYYHHTSFSESHQPRYDFNHATLKTPE